MWLKLSTDLVFSYIFDKLFPTVCPVRNKFKQLRTSIQNGDMLVIFVSKTIDTGLFNVNACNADAVFNVEICVVAALFDAVEQQDIDVVRTILDTGGVELNRCVQSICKMLFYNITHSNIQTFLPCILSCWLGYLVWDEIFVCKRKKCRFKNI